MHTIIVQFSNRARAGHTQSCSPYNSTPSPSVDWIAQKPTDRIHHGVLIFASILLLIIKIPTLDLPHYWDEAFPYSYAIGYMTEHGPGILSDAAPAEYTTGHPLLYYFLQASWNMLVGDTIWMQRILPLIFSLGSLWLTFFMGRLLFNARIASGAVILFVCQSGFLGNATFQLPETLLTLLMLSTICFLCTGRKWLFVVFATLLLFTKEPAVVLLLLIFLFHFFIILRNKPWKQRLNIWWIYTIPVALNLLFYVHQYFTRGWFLFPRHTGFMDFGTGFFTDQLSRYFAHLMIYEGRNGMLFTAVILLMYYLIKNRRSLRLTDIGRNSILPGTLIAGYLLFSSVNFYSNRYILCLYPLFCLLVSAILCYALPIRLLYVTGIMILAAVTLWFSFTNKNTSDHSLGYADSVRCQMEVIAFCRENGLQDTTIQTGFLMSKYLTSHYPRYIEKDDLFTRVNSVPPAEAQVFILCSNEKYLYNEPALKDFVVVFKSDKGKSSCEVLYKNVD